MAALLALVLPGTAGAYPHLDAGRTYRADIKGGGTDGATATLFLYTDPGSKFGKSAHLALYCPGLTPTIPPFPITQRRARAGYIAPFVDVFSYASPYRNLAYIEFSGRVVRPSDPIPRLNLTVSGLSGCADQSHRSVRKWTKLPAKKDDTVVREILQGRRFDSKLSAACPSQSKVGDQVSVSGVLSPDGGGTTVTITERSSLEDAAAEYPMVTQVDGSYGFTFTPQPDGVGEPYTQTLTVSFGGDLMRKPTSTTCSWPVLPF